MDHGHIKIDLEKVRAIQEWRTLANVKELCLFLRLTNYYRTFVEGYSRKVAPLTELLKKGVTWEWIDEYQKTFNELKTAMINGPILALLTSVSPLKCRRIRPTLLWEGCFCKRATP